MSVTPLVTVHSVHCPVQHNLPVHIVSTPELVEADDDVLVRRLAKGPTSDQPAASSSSQPPASRLPQLLPQDELLHVGEALWSRSAVLGPLTTGAGQQAGWSFEARLVVFVYLAAHLYALVFMLSLSYTLLFFLTLALVLYKYALPSFTYSTYT